MWSEDFSQEPIPPRAARRRIEVNGRQFRDEVFAPVWTEFAGVKVKSAIFNIQEPPVRIKILSRNRDALLSLRKFQKGIRRGSGLATDGPGRDCLPLPL